MSMTHLDAERPGTTHTTPGRIGSARPSIHSRLPSTRALHAFGGTTLARRRNKRKQSQHALSSGSLNAALELDGENGETLAVSGRIKDGDDSSPLDQMTTKDIDTIKELPCNMKEKRQIRKYLLKKGSRSSGTDAQVREGTSAVRKFSDYGMEFLYGLRLWEKSIYEIEGRFGSAVRSYFAFLRFLFYVNLGVFLLIFCFVVLPSILYTEYGDPAASSGTSCAYEPYDSNEINSFVQYIIWWFTGQGFMEKTYLFMGYYENVSNLLSGSVGLNYSIPLAYILVAFAYFLVSLAALVSRAARGLRESVVTDEDRFYSYCNKVFAGWDYCINDDDAADIKHQSIFNEIRADINEEQLRAVRLSRTTKQKVKLYFKRAFINVIVLLILAGAFAAIYFTALYATTNTETYDESYIVDLIVTYLVSIVITFVNFIAPVIFNFLITKEEYSPDFTIKFTLIRTVLLRLASIVFLYVVVYIQVNCPEDKKTNVTSECSHCENVVCWETYLGQEMYKLTILDFFIVVFFTLFVEFPRKLIATKCSCTLADKIGIQEFNLPVKVLDIVYAQTICWIGAFYAPLLPGIVVLKFFIFFYLQKVSLVYNCQPSKTPFRASRTGTFFFLILLFGFLVAIVPVVVGISVLKPSMACGPYRGETKMFDVITNGLLKTPEAVQNMFWFFGSAPFALILMLILLVIIYYYRALDAAYKNMIKVLRDQLVMEGKDKQFLLKRAIKLSDHLIENGLALDELNFQTELPWQDGSSAESVSDSTSLRANDGGLEMKEYRDHPHSSYQYHDNYEDNDSQ